MLNAAGWLFVLAAALGVLIAHPTVLIVVAVIGVTANLVRSWRD